MVRFFLVLLFLASGTASGQDSLEVFLEDFGRYAAKNDESLLLMVGDMKSMESSAVLAGMDPIERMLYRRNCSQLNVSLREISSVSCRHALVARLVAIADSSHKSEAITILLMCIDSDIKCTKGVVSAIASDPLINSLDSTKKEAQSMRDRARLHRDKMIEFRERLFAISKSFD